MARQPLGAICYLCAGAGWVHRSEPALVFGEHVLRAEPCPACPVLRPLQRALNRAKAACVVRMLRAAGAVAAPLTTTVHRPPSLSPPPTP